MRLVPTQSKSLEYQVAANFNGEPLIPRITELFSLLGLTLASVGACGITAYSAPHERNRSTHGPRREPQHRSLLGGGEQNANKGGSKFLVLMIGYAFFASHRLGSRLPLRNLLHLTRNRYEILFKR
jgi:hypothetical protein